MSFSILLLFGFVVKNCVGRCLEAVVICGSTSFHQIPTSMSGVHRIKGLKGSHAVAVQLVVSRGNAQTAAVPPLPKSQTKPFEDQRRRVDIEFI
jgi:hypothetical protein